MAGGTVSTQIRDTSVPLAQWAPLLAASCGMDRSLVYRLAVEPARFTLFEASDAALNRANEIVPVWVASNGMPAYRVERPETFQRNRALLNADIVDTVAFRESDYNQRIQRRLDIEYPENDQLRVLVCSGPRLLAWVGGFRRRRPFAQRERRQLQRLVPALRARLTYEQRIRGNVGAAAFDALFHQLASPAVLVASDGRIIESNAKGRCLANDSVRIRRCISADADASLEVITIDLQGRRYFLLLDDEPCAHARLREKASEWKLTVRETEVAEQLLKGLSNKEIALRLTCAPGTVEVHVGNVLRKARVESRSRFVAVVVERP